MNEALSHVASTGVMGSLLVIVLFGYYQKDKKLAEESAARIKDGEETRKLLMQVQSGVLDAVHKLAEIVEYVEKRSEESPRRRM